MKTVLVTGASRGIGAEIARVFGEHGDQVIINYHHSQKQAEALCEELRAQGASAIALQADVSNREQVQNMIKKAVSSMGPIDVLINNAGIGEQKLFTDLLPEEWQRMMDVHVQGAFHCTQEVLPEMIRRKSGCILNVSSIWGVSGASCEVHYSTAKAALIGFTKALAREVGPSGIRVNCIAPGVIQTEMNEHLSSDVLESLQEEIALCTLGTPRDIADAAFFFASEQARFITGQVLTVDGGMI